MNVDAGVGSDALAQAIIVNETGDNRDPHYAPEEHGVCANCDTVLTGRYCHACGQSAHIHRSLLHMLEELLHGIFHFETKAWRTIPALIFSPGKLTRNYIAGQRTRYVSPLALFLFLIFLMFFVFSITSTHYTENIDKKSQNAHVSINKDLDTAKADLAKLVATRASLAKGDAKIEELDEEIASTRTEISLLEVALKSTKTDIKNTSKTDDKSIPKVNSDIKTDSADELKDALNLTLDDKDISVSPWIKAAIQHAKENPDLILYKMKSAASKFAFLLMPISLPFLWLMFAFKRQYVMFDHAVFSLYSLSFMALLIMLITILGRFDFSASAGAFAVFAPPIHMFAQLRGTYALNKWEALWRTISLLFIALISLIIYALLVIRLSA